WQDLALYATLFMAIFAMRFGTRRAAATEHNRRLVLAMGFESLLKLTAMLALGGRVVFALFSGPVQFAQRAPSPPLSSLDSFLTLMLLGALAMFTLPHQFHIGVVECRQERHLRTARWLFPVFLVLISLPVLPLVGDRKGTRVDSSHLSPSSFFPLHDALPISQRSPSPPLSSLDSFLTLMLLGALAMFTLPHQFHIGVVECRQERHLRTARWLFPVFLVLISLPVLPLA